MARRIESSFPVPDEGDTRFESVHFLDEQADDRVYNNYTFQFCTFEKIGMKGAKFSHCTFKHCEFIDCYLAHVEFEHCQFPGSFFDRCVFSWASFPNSGLDYTNFSNCGPVLSQVRLSKPKDPQAAAKFFRNLASEHKKLGNWEEVDKYIMEAYRERERHFWYAVSGKNDHYRRRYAGFQRINYVFRLLSSKASGLILGYGISWTVFARSIILFGLILFPFLNFLLGKSVREIQNIGAERIDGAFSYVSSIYIVTIRSLFPFVPSPNASLDFSIPFWLSSLEAIFGTVMVAVFAALLFRWASKGL